MSSSSTLRHSTDPVFKLINGDFSDDWVKAVSKICPNGKLRIIFSSTFTDTRVERNHLIEVIYPKLQIKARAYGIDVVFVDMRFGVKDENTNDHLTWIACADQILRCYTESDGLFFVSLQRNKYGYMMVPKFLTEDIVNGRMSSWSSDVQNLFLEWYKIDYNAVPVHYALKNLNGNKETDKCFWGDANGTVGALATLREALQGISFDEESSESIVVGQSVTEYEVRLAIALDPLMTRCAWVHRQFAHSITAAEDGRGLFCDFIGATQESVQEKYTNLLKLMHSKF